MSPTGAQTENILLIVIVQPEQLNLASVLGVMPLMGHGAGSHRLMQFLQKKRSHPSPRSYLFPHEI
jgi:hypothetical protein